MTEKELKRARNKDLPASLVAMRRAARLARERARRTGTAIVVLQGRKLVRIKPSAPRKRRAR